MGTKTNSGRRRAERRGVAAFVSFLLLFAFALGQGSSLTAFAVDGSDAPVATTGDGSAVTSTDVPADASAADASTTDVAPATDPAATDPAPAPDADATQAPAAPAPTATSAPTRKTTTVSRPHRTISRPATTRRTISRLTAPRTGRALAAPSGSLSGGAIGLDFVAAGPFTYNHVSGVGGAYASRTISKNNGVVESLEGGDFKCNDLVVFFTQVVVDGSAGGSGAVDIDYSFGAETTGQPGIGFDDIVSVGLNSPDSGNSGLDGDESVTLISETPDPPGDQQGYDRVLGTVRVSNLDPGEHLIVRLVVHLGCQVGASPTGNIQSAIESAGVVGDGKVNVGQETVPFKKVEDVAQPGMDVNKTCPATAAIGDQITYTIQIVNTGNEALNLQSVIDTVDSHAGVNITSSFPASVAANSSVSRTYQYTVLAGDPDPLPNTVAVVAKGATSQATLNGSASCDTDILHPAIKVTKTCPASAAVGADITYGIEIENIGDEALDNIVVSDTVDGNAAVDISNLFVSSLAVGASDSAQYTYDADGTEPDPLSNSVLVSADGVTSNDTVTDSDSCQTDITHQPGISVTKTCPQSAAFGEDVTFTITITNTGNEALNDVVVTDALLGGDITAAFNLPDPLPVGNTEYSHQFTYTPGANEDPVQNSVHVEGVGADSGVSAQDDASCDTDITHQPGISVTKICPQSVPAGDQITYTITVTNTGNEALTDLSVLDTLLGDITDQFSPDLSQGLGVGDSATAEVTYSPAPGQDPVQNSVTATGLGADSEAEATDTATCTTDVLQPAIQIVKGGPALVHRGDTITYTFEVTNPGEVELFDVVLSDPICDPGTITPGADVDGSLAVGEVWHFSCTHLVTESDPDPIPNTATVRGDTHQGEGGQEVTDTDDHVVDIIHPGIAVVKTVSRDTVPVGTTVTYTYVVTNIGDTTLYDVSVDDDIMGHIGDIAILEPGASVTLTKDFVVGDEPVTNVATVSGSDILGRSVNATDDASVAPILGGTTSPPGPGGEGGGTAFTGSELGRLGFVALALFGLGVGVVAVTRRRRPQRDSP